MSNSEIKALVQYRLEQADEALQYKKMGRKLQNSKKIANIDVAKTLEWYNRNPNLL